MAEHDFSTTAPLPRTGNTKADSVLLRGGIVCDPKRGTEARADVLVEGGRVVAIASGLTVAPPSRTHVIEVTDMRVGPGFVDLHSHVHTVAGQWLQACDGVTTALDLESGLMPIERAYEQATKEGRVLNYGFSASWSAARGAALLGFVPTANPRAQLALLGNEAWMRPLSRSQMTSLLSHLETELSGGALGIGVLLGYAPQSDPEEFLALSRLAAGAGVATYTHVRELIEADPTTPVDGPTELCRAADQTGARTHHCHVNSTSRGHIDRVLHTLDRARSRGVPVSVEAYPYGAGSTAIGASFLHPDRLGRWGLEPENIIVQATQERVADAARLEKLRQMDPAAACIVEFVDERLPDGRAQIVRSLAYPNSIIASDAMPLEWSGRPPENSWPLPPGAQTHPRTAGTFSKAARLMVREAGLWSWPELFRRCSYLPARLLDSFCPAARGKGRLVVGADADIVVIDPQSFRDRATFASPAQPAAGVVHLFVAGVPVITRGDLDPTARPGQPLRAQPK